MLRPRLVTGLILALGLALPVPGEASDPDLDSPEVRRVKQKQANRRREAARRARQRREDAKTVEAVRRAEEAERRADEAEQDAANAKVADREQGVREALAKCEATSDACACGYAALSLRRRCGPRGLAYERRSLTCRKYREHVAPKTGHLLGGISAAQKQVDEACRVARRKTDGPKKRRARPRPRRTSKSSFPRLSYDECREQGKLRACERVAAASVKTAWGRERRLDAAHIACFMKAANCARAKALDVEAGLERSDGERRRHGETLARYDACVQRSECKAAAEIGLRLSQRENLYHAFKVLAAGCKSAKGAARAKACELSKALPGRICRDSSSSSARRRAACREAWDRGDLGTPAILHELEKARDRLASFHRLARERCKESEGAIRAESCAAAKASDPRTLAREAAKARARAQAEEARAEEARVKEARAEEAARAAEDARTRAENSRRLVAERRARERAEFAGEYYDRCASPDERVRKACRSSLRRASASDRLKGHAALCLRESDVYQAGDYKSSHPRTPRCDAAMMEAKRQDIAVPGFLPLIPAGKFREAIVRRSAQTHGRALAKAALARGDREAFAASFLDRCKGGEVAACRGLVHYSWDLERLEAEQHLCVAESKADFSAGPDGCRTAFRDTLLAGRPLGPLADLGEAALGEHQSSARSWVAVRTKGRAPAESRCAAGKASSCASVADTYYFVEAQLPWLEKACTLSTRRRYCARAATAALQLGRSLDFLSDVETKHRGRIEREARARVFGR